MITIVIPEAKTKLLIQYRSNVCANLVLLVAGIQLVFSVSGNCIVVVVVVVEKFMLLLVLLLEGFKIFEIIFSGHKERHK